MKYLLFTYQSNCLFQLTDKVLISFIFEKNYYLISFPVIMTKLFLICALFTKIHPSQLRNVPHRRWIVKKLLCIIRKWSTTHLQVTFHLFSCAFTIHAHFNKLLWGFLTVFFLQFSSRYIISQFSPPTQNPQHQSFSTLSKKWESNTYIRTFQSIILHFSTINSP